MPVRLFSATHSLRSIVHCVVEGGCALVVAVALGGGGPAASTKSGNSSMFFGLFKSKYRTTVRPELGGAFKRETAFPADLTRMAEVNPELMGWLREAAGWASQVIAGVGDITAKVIRGILVAKMSVQRHLATQAIASVVGRGVPLPLVLGGATALAGTVLG